MRIAFIQLDDLVSNLVKDVRDEGLAVGIPSREKIVELSSVPTSGCRLLEKKKIGIRPYLSVFCLGDAAPQS